MRIAADLREDIERSIKNSRSFTGKHRFLAINNDGGRIGASANAVGYWDGCGGYSDMRLGAKKMALSQCGGGCPSSLRA